MPSRIVGIVLAVLIANVAHAEDSIVLRFQGRRLTPGDQFTVSSTVQYTVIDPNRKASSKQDGGIVIDAAMVEFSLKSPSRGMWKLTVPKDGRYSGKDVRFPFSQNIKPVPGRLTTYLVSVAFSRSTMDEDGKPISFRREQAFPITIAENSVPKDLCVVFEGAAGGLLTVGVRPNCSDSLTATTTGRSIPAPHP